MTESAPTVGYEFGFGDGERAKIVSGRLPCLGAPASTVRHLREAIEADQVLSIGITAGSRWVDPDTHPLAASVHRRTLTNLITWPESAWVACLSPIRPR